MRDGIRLQEGDATVDRQIELESMNQLKTKTEAESNEDKGKII